jgi:hypothetical protein
METPDMGPGKAASLLREIALWPLIDPANPRRGVTVPTDSARDCSMQRPQPHAASLPPIPRFECVARGDTGRGRPLPRQGGISAAIEPFQKHHIKQILADAPQSHLRAICATPAGKHAS